MLVSIKSWYMYQLQNKTALGSSEKVKGKVQASSTACKCGKKSFEISSSLHLLFTDSCFCQGNFA